MSISVRVMGVRQKPDPGQAFMGVRLKPDPDLKQEDIVNVDLRTCTSAEAAVLLAPEVRQIVRDIIAPVACERDSERTGGWFAFWRGDPSGEIVMPVVGFPAGLVSPERYLKYIHFANEKAVRLARRPADISSFQSRDESDPNRMNHKYGGAIRCGTGGTRLIFSFSGFSELEDEQICVILARRAPQELTDDELEAIIKWSSNGRLVTLLNSSNTERPS